MSKIVLGLCDVYIDTIKLDMMHDEKGCKKGFTWF